MAKLYFKFGTMGSSKTAQALITKFNYEELDMGVLLLKPVIDSRDGADDVIKSRVGLTAKVTPVAPGDNLYKLFEDTRRTRPLHVIIVDECQFLTPAQVDDLSQITIDFDIPVICFGLRTDFRTKLFPGSARLFELADSITEIKYICKCGKKAAVNARIVNGKVVTEGEQIFIGGNESYIAMCKSCWQKRIAEDRKDMI